MTNMILEFLHSASPSGRDLFQQPSFSGRPKTLPHVFLQALYVETEQSEGVKFSTVALKFRQLE